MNEDIDLVKLEQATFRIANQDGLTEMWMGLMIAAIALVLIQTAFVGTVAILIIFQAVLTEKVKERFTYPRIGKVKLRGEAEMPTGYGWIFAIVIMIPAIASVAFSTRIENDLLFLLAQWAPVLIGIGLIQPTLYLVEKSNLKRYYGIGAFATIAGLAFTLLDFPTPVYRMTLYLAFVGAIFFLAGLTSLVRFVKKYPILDLEDVSDEQDQ
ncbi:MAG: hypothetical protein ACFFE6_06490 [Candidatus Thorarchaeota archaeon]